MPRGQNLHPMFRSSHKRYTERPPSNCPTAREAWDALTDEAHGPITCLWLHDGYWMASYADGSYADHENTFAVNRALRERAAAAKEAA